MELLPTVNIDGLAVTRFIIGANPFAGFSHQNPRRDEEMRSWYTVERIIETWRRAEAAGINTMITNNTTEHVVEAVRRYLAGGGSLQWIAQVSDAGAPSMFDALDEVVRIGCRALYFHGGIVDDLYAKQDVDTLEKWVAHAKSYGIPVGAAGHAPEVHRWVDSLDLVDFHNVAFFNCGSLHAGKGEEFRLEDLPRAVEVSRDIPKPCIAYKIMGAGRIDPRMALEYAFRHIKPGDAVNVGMHRGDKDDMVEENAALVREILAAP